MGKEIFQRPKRAFSCGGGEELVFRSLISSSISFSHKAQNGSSAYLPPVFS